MTGMSENGGSGAKVQTLIEEKLLKIASKSAGISSPRDHRFYDAHRNDDAYTTVYDSLGFDMNLCGFSLSGKILDLGSGCGTFVKVCSAHGLDATGVEPDNDVIEVARLKGVGHDIVKGVGEFLPFREGSFDIVASMSVLEHVKDPRRVVLESVRVLKSKGVLWLDAPDYSRCFHEGHYGLFWIPLMPKRIAKLYVRARGRIDAAYVDSIQYVTRSEVMNTLRGLRVKIIDVGKAKTDYVKEYARTSSTEKAQRPETVSVRALRTLLTILKRIGFSEKTLAKLCLVFYSLQILKSRLRHDAMFVMIVQKL